MTWVVSYDKRKDCVTNDIITIEYRDDKSALASVSNEESEGEDSASAADQEGHQWIMGTGCGSDLISRAKVEDHKLRRSKAKNPIQFQTANGNTKGTEVVNMNIVEFEEDVEPYVLPDTPSVLSIGRRCMHEGYHFIWLANKHPYMITPSRKLVALAVEDDIPYRISGDPRCQPVDPTREMSIPCLLEHMKEVAGLNPQPAAPAEVADEGDRMIEAALRQMNCVRWRQIRTFLSLRQLSPFLTCSSFLCPA